MAAAGYAAPPTTVVAMVVVLLLGLQSPCARALLDAEQNITGILGRASGFSLFNRLLSRTGVADEINARSSVTVLAPDDAALGPLLAGYEGGGIPQQEISDTLRYHVLLEYMDVPDMRARPPGQLVTTLFQTTGRAAGQLGSVSLSVRPDGTVGIAMPFPGAPPNASVISTIALFPYNISVLQIDRVLVPPELAQPPPPRFPQINITDVLVRADRFDTFVAFLQATGVDQTFQDSESKEGITIFAPADVAFASLPAASLQKLTAQQKILVLEYHALNTYYALGTLKEFKNPVAPTVATSDPLSGGAGQFTVNVTSVDGVCTIYTGIVAAPVVDTVLEEAPVSVFVIDKVLLPKSLFGHKDEGPSSSALVPSSPLAVPPSYTAGAPSWNVVPAALPPPPWPPSSMQNVSFLPPYLVAPTGAYHPTVPSPSPARSSSSTWTVRALFVYPLAGFSFVLPWLYYGLP